MAGTSEARDLAGQALGGSRVGERLRRFADEYRVEGAMLAALILLCVVLSIIQPRFITAGNIRNVLWQVTAVGIIAIGQTLVILTGGIDLSVGGIAAFSAMIGGLLMTQGGGEHVVLGIVATLLVGLLVGIVNGVIVAYGMLAAFIVTLGMRAITHSLTYVASDAKSIVGLPDGYRAWGKGDLGGVPYYLITFIALFVLGHILLTRTKAGRFIYAIGSNEEAARLSGVNVRLYKVLPYALTGLLCAISALILSGKLGAIDPDTGTDIELDTIAAVVIGGTSLFGGKGSLVGTLIGVFLIGVLSNGLNLLRVNAFWQGTAVGVVIILSVLIERLSRKRS
ncbi:MAG TPA: ABC transporter permease [Thermomicrobiales bacterium]|nr:ABC transporter permease [Thermomicrobiales bacterium]